MKKNLRNFLAIFSILVICAGLGWFFWDEYAVTEIASFQKTDEWAAWKTNLPKGTSPEELQSNDSSIPIEKKPGIFIRIDAPNKRLLLKHNYSNVIYAFVSETKNIDRVTEADWSAAAGKITACRYQLGGDYNTKVDVTDTWRDYTVKHNGHAFNTYARYALFATESPTHNKVAILSAYGPVKPSFPSLFFGLGGSEAIVYGRRYVQIGFLGNTQQLGDAVRLAKSDYIEKESLCWSEDEKFLVVYKPYSVFSVVEVRILTD